MLRRLVPFAAFGTVLVLTPGALAAPKACKLVRDERDDVIGTVDFAPTNRFYGDTDLDILSADVATNAKYVTAVVRPATLRADNTQSPLGRMWQLWFSVEGKTFSLSAVAAPDGEVAQLAYEAAPGEVVSVVGLGRVSLTLDYQRREVRMTAPVSRFAPHASMRRGQVISDLVVHTYKHYGVSGQDQQGLPENDAPDLANSGVATGADTARSTRRYVAGSPSCVTPGR